jgi:hypothetical protein
MESERLTTRQVGCTTWVTQILTAHCIVWAMKTHRFLNKIRNIIITLKMRRFLDFVHRQEFWIIRKHNFSETGCVSAFKGGRYLLCWVPPPQDGNTFTSRNVLFPSFENTGLWTNSRNLVILSVIHQRQNPLEYTFIIRLISLFLRKCMLKYVNTYKFDKTRQSRYLISIIIIIIIPLLRHISLFLYSDVLCYAWQALALIFVALRAILICIHL